MQHVFVPYYRLLEQSFAVDPEKNLVSSLLLKFDSPFMQVERACRLANDSQQTIADCLCKAACTREFVVHGAAEDYIKQTRAPSIEHVCVFDSFSHLQHLYQSRFPGDNLNGSRERSSRSAICNRRHEEMSFRRCPDVLSAGLDCAGHEQDCAAGRDGGFGNVSI